MKGDYLRLWVLQQKKSGLLEMFDTLHNSSWERHVVMYGGRTEVPIG